MIRYRLNLAAVGCIFAFSAAVVCSRVSASAAGPPLPTWQPDGALLDPTGDIERRHIYALGFHLFLPGNHYPAVDPPRSLDWSLDVVQSVQIDGQAFKLLPVVESGTDAPTDGRIRWLILHAPEDLPVRLTAPMAAKYALDYALTSQGTSASSKGAVSTKPEPGLIHGFKFARAYFKQPSAGGDGHPSVLHGIVYAAALDGDILALIGTAMEDPGGAYRKTLARLEAHVLTIQRQERDQSLGNLIQIATATLAYAFDWDEVLPPMQSTAAFKKAVMPYIQSAAVFVSPATGVPYTVNRTLSRLHLSQIQDPASVVLAYESSPTREGTRGVVFMDAHAARIQESQWAALKRASHIP